MCLQMFVDFGSNVFGRVYPAEYGAAVGTAFLQSRGAVVVGEATSNKLSVKAFEEMLEDVSDLCDDAQLREATEFEA